MKFLLILYFLIQITSKECLESLSRLVLRNNLLFLWEKYFLVVLFSVVTDIFPKDSHIFYLFFCSEDVVNIILFYSILLN